MNEIYWMTRLDSLKTLLGFIIAITVVFAIIGVSIMIATCGRDTESERKGFKIGKRLTTILGKHCINIWHHQLLHPKHPRCVYDLWSRWHY